MITQKNHPLRTDILFISMPSRSNSVLPPLGFIVLSGFLDKHTEFSSAIFEKKISSILEVTSARKSEIEKDILAQIQEQNPRFIGFSLFPGDLNDFLSLARQIKVRFPEIKVIVGGVLPTIDTGSLLFDESPVDFLVRGDGEGPLSHLLAGGVLTEVPGLAWMEGGKLCDTGIATYAMELDYIPSYHKIDMAYYCQVSTEIIRPYYTKGIFVFSAVGCPHRCSFCFNPKTKLKYKDLDVFIEELRLLKETYGINSFFILDECFLANKERVVRFCARYKESGIDMPWAMQTRSNLLKEENIGMLKDSGCVHISFGVETGSPRLLKAITKGLTVDDNLAAFNLCRKHGIKTFANMLYNLPGETAEDIELSRQFLEKARPNHVALSLTVPLLGTQIYNEFVKPPLEREEYEIFGSNEPYTRIVDKRFRLAAHDLALNKILARESIKYYLKTSFGLLSMDQWYVQGVLRRMPLPELARAISKKIFKQVRSYFRAVLQLSSSLFADKNKRC
jgi:radical SAM superfamily enzyme YgiQ (UPF0313 family)